MIEIIFNEYKHYFSVLGIDEFNLFQTLSRILDLEFSAM